MLRMALKLLPCVSQPPTTSVTTEMPASTSRRARRKSSLALPYFSRTAAGSRSMSNASRVLVEATMSSARTV